MATPTRTKVLVIGGGPGGYAAAFHAADLGLEVTLVDRERDPGGVCLYRGCIPSKALLHVARLIHEAKTASAFGVEFAAPRIDLARLAAWKDSVIARLTGGLGQLARGRKVRYVQGAARLLGSNRAAIQTASGDREEVTFEHCIIATGSRPIEVRSFPNGSRFLWDSTAALALERIPARLLVVGGGYIGLELSCVYAALGSRVTIVEMTPGLLTGCDRDLAKVVTKRMETTAERVLVGTKVAAARELGEGLEVELELPGGEKRREHYDRVLVAVGRRPVTEGLGLETTKVLLDAHGFIPVDAARRTADPAIFAIGDVAGQPLLAHKASAEGRVAAEVIAGKRTAYEPLAVPAVVFTDPEVAWCGLTETEAEAKGIKVAVARFPWQASGRALSMGLSDGITKLIIDPESERILGVGIAGTGAGELIGEGVLAVEMGAVARDLELSIHAHPTLSETLMEAAGAFYGHATHVMAKRQAR